MWLRLIARSLGSAGARVIEGVRGFEQAIAGPAFNYRP